MARELFYGGLLNPSYSANIADTKLRGILIKQRCEPWTPQINRIFTLQNSIATTKAIKDL